MATIKQELHNIGRSLTNAADAGEYTAVAKWAKKALAIVGGVRVIPVVAPTPESHVPAGVTAIVFAACATVTTV